jgi:hypothetical protein
METKKCTKCGIEKSLDEYYNESRVKDGKQARCKQCAKDYYNTYRKTNPDIYRKASLKHWHNLNLKKKQERWIKRYGITLEQYEKMYAKQNGVCKICKNPCVTRNLLSVDHCHTTGKVRGLLCVKCNTALGMLNDNIALLSNAILYLKDSEE